MAYGNNRAGGQGRAHFRQAGGTVMKFRHPYFAGAIDNPNSKVAIDEIDVSASVKLEGRFFEANQNQDSAKQTVLIDGSTVTITNKMLNGTMNIPAVPTTGEVATGDFIAGCQLIQSVGDNVGGIFTKTDFVNGKRVYDRPMRHHKTAKLIEPHSQVKAPHAIFEILLSDVNSLTPRRECNQSHPPFPWSQIRPTVMTSYYHCLLKLSICSHLILP